MKLTIELLWDTLYWLGHKKRDLHSEKIGSKFGYCLHAVIGMCYSIVAMADIPLPFKPISFGEL